MPGVFEFALLGVVMLVVASFVAYRVGYRLGRADAHKPDRSG